MKKKKEIKGLPFLSLFADEVIDFPKKTDIVIELEEELEMRKFLGAQTVPDKEEEDLGLDLLEISNEGS